MKKIFNLPLPMFLALVVLLIGAISLGSMAIGALSSKNNQYIEFWLGTSTPQTEPVCRSISQQVVGTAEWIGGNFKLSFHSYPAAECPTQNPINWEVTADDLGVALGQFNFDPSDGRDVIAFEQKIASNTKVVIIVEGKQFVILPDQTTEFNLVIAIP